MCKNLPRDRTWPKVAVGMGRGKVDGFNKRTA